MTIHMIQAKSLLNPVKQPDTWFGLKYNMNLYRGCQHRCIYCDSRSQCYRIDRFDQDILVKANAPELLRSELARKRVKGTIGTGSMNDPYMPLEKKLNLTRRALEIIATFRFPVHVITKSDLVLRDADVLQQIGQIYAAVSFTITTANDDLGKQVEPGAPLPSARFHALQKLAEKGIYAGVTLMPVLPFLQDDPQNIRAIVRRAADSGAQYIIASFGVTLRDRQRAYFYNELDRRFPGVKQQYVRSFGEQYFAPARQMAQLTAVFQEACAQAGIARRIQPFTVPPATQLPLFSPPH
ncbi:MAG: radical SAM protein [Ardenticatenaceae bacterium]|nr:radical SAM protein [Ardenticatenaceae bacterium]